MINKILFVCTGNTCRSVMANSIYKKRCEEENIITNAKSVGINVIVRSPANALTISTMKKFNINIKDHISRQITKNDVASSDVILTMEKYHKYFIEKNLKESKNKVYTLYEYIKNVDKDIEDPYGKGEQKYLEVAKEIMELIYNMK